MENSQQSDNQNENNDTIDQEDLAKAEQMKASSEPKMDKERKPVMVTIADVELERLKKEASENKDKYLRSLAEQENARKRLQKEKEQMTQYAIQNAITDFLIPIDHLENALKFTEQMSDEVKTWGHGFQMILAQFKEALQNNGVTALTSLGKPFDPHVHEAVETVETNDYPPGTVIEESIRGYKMGDKIVRPARVKVAKAPSKSSSEDKK